MIDKRVPIQTNRALFQTDLTHNTLTDLNRFSLSLNRESQTPHVPLTGHNHLRLALPPPAILYICTFDASHPQKQRNITAPIAR